MTAPPTSNDHAAVREPGGTGRLTPRARRLLTTLFMIIAGALVAYAVHRFLRTESVEETVTVTPLAEPKELAARRRDAIGTYATGSAPGDRVIVVGADGRVEFSEIGADPATSRTMDSWQLARRDRKFCLTTDGSGILDITNIDTIVYYGDTYRRTK